MRSISAIKITAYVLVLLVCCFGAETVWSIEVGGPQAGVWTKNESPYIVMSDIIVPTGMTLTIEAGVVVKFSDYYSIKVNGTLKAMGIIRERIVFTSIHDKEFGVIGEPTSILPGNKDWPGIEFTPSSGSRSSLEYCIIRYTDKAILSAYANPSLTNIIIADCNINSLDINGRKVAVQEGSEQNYSVPTSLTSTPSPQSTTPSILPDINRVTPPFPERQTQSFQIEEELISAEEFTFGEIMVVTATKQEQKITEAPAIISVITQEQIDQMPVENLYEILTYIPGVSTIETYYGYTSVTFRGVLQTHYNNKSLLLLNGHPLYETVVGSYYLEEIPKDAIKRVEVIRGPGSVLYGTNAFAGVINVITKDSNDLNGFSVSAEAGSFQTALGSFSFGKKSNDIDFFISGSYKNSNGYPYQVEADEENRSGEPVYPDDRDAYENDYMNVFTALKYKGLKLQGFVFRSEKDKFGLIPTLAGTGERRIDGYGFDVKFEKVINDKFSFSAFGWYDYFSKLERLEKYPPLYWIPGTNTILPGNREFQEYSGSKMGSELQLNYNPLQNLSLLGGAVYENTQSDPYLFYLQDTGELDSSAIAYLTEYDSYDISSYFQANWKLTSVIGLIGGVRHNKNKEYGAVVTPRAGMILNFNNRMFVKALYGQAFRSPNFFEKYVQTKNVLNGNAGLLPEEVQTIELGAEYLLRKTRFSVNYFYLTTDNIINRSAIADSGTFGHTQATPMYGNSDGQEIQGLEMEISGYPAPNIYFFLNLTYKTGIEKSTEEDIDFIANYIGNAGINLKLHPKVDFAAYLQSISKREGVLTNDSTAVIDPYTIANLQVNYKLSSSVTLSLIAKNVFNTEYFYPEYIRKNISSVPGGPGQAFYIKLKSNL